MKGCLDCAKVYGNIYHVYCPYCGEKLVDDTDLKRRDEIKKIIEGAK